MRQFTFFCSNEGAQSAPYYSEKLLSLNELVDLVFYYLISDAEEFYQTLNAQQRLDAMEASFKSRFPTIYAEVSKGPAVRNVAALILATFVYSVRNYVWLGNERDLIISELLSQIRIILSSPFNKGFCVFSNAEADEVGALIESYSERIDSPCTFSSPTLGVGGALIEKILDGYKLESTGPMAFMTESLAINTKVAELKGRYANRLQWVENS